MKLPIKNNDLKITDYEREFFNQVLQLTKGIWITKDKEHIKLSDLSIKHLISIRHRTHNPIIYNEIVMRAIRIDRPS